MTGIGEEPGGATPLDPDELQGLKFAHITTRGELNELEQANITQGLRWLGQRRTGTDILDAAFVRTLHRRLFGDVWQWAGAFRQTGKNLGVDPARIGEQLRILLDDARYWTKHETYPPLEAAARFHHRLVQIHCFANGNGRHARIMTDEFLRHCHDHKPIDWAAGYDLMKDNRRRDQYIAALKAADGNEYGPLLTFAGAASQT
ncbi:MAG: cell filamentation protein Fic [Rhodobacterales bacterium CG15_BIG_FIL_POST_REV_8_21_14_020_59_13]|nr:MAG: cell filamentation protein Fic [Rhodobacterales bacterium CG15_BIG_FIL_POST_REV_8_21_14_020_59_13]